MVRAAPWLEGLPCPSPSLGSRGRGCDGEGASANSHKCTLIPGDMQAARRAGKQFWDQLGSCGQGWLGGGEGGMAPNTVEACGELRDRDGEVTPHPRGRQHKAAAGEHSGNPEGWRSLEPGPPRPRRTRPLPHTPLSQGQGEMDWTVLSRTDPESHSGPFEKCQAGSDALLQPSTAWHVSWDSSVTVQPH